MFQDEFTLNNLEFSQATDRPQTSNKYSSGAAKRHNRTKTQMRNTSTNWDRQTLKQQSPGLKRNGTLQKRNSSNFIKMKKQIRQGHPSLRKASQNFKIGMTLQQYIGSNSQLKPIAIYQKEQEQLLQFNKVNEENGMLNSENQAICRQNFMIDQKEEYQWQTKQTPQILNPLLNRKGLNLGVKEIKKQNGRQSPQKNFNIRNINNIYRATDRSKQKSSKQQEFNKKLQKLKNLRKVTNMDLYKNTQLKINFAEYEGNQDYLLKKYGNKFKLKKQQQQYKQQTQNISQQRDQLLKFNNQKPQQRYNNLNKKLQSNINDKMKYKLKIK